MNWHLYKKDDPNTWPEIDCPILVYDETWCEFYICKWNSELGRFVEPKGKILHCWTECYYQYIEYMPNGYEATKVKKCNSFTNARCPYEDDGYCFDSPRQTKCKYMVEETEYSINYKRIWEEFKK